jgi:hypothetical protein
MSAVRPGQLGPQYPSATPRLKASTGCAAAASDTEGRGHRGRHQQGCQPGQGPCPAGHPGHSSTSVGGPSRNPRLDLHRQRGSPLYGALELSGFEHRELPSDDKARLGVDDLSAGRAKPGGDAGAG